MISDLTIARAAFAHATTAADGLLGAAAAQLKLADAPRQAACRSAEDRRRTRRCRR